MIPSGLEGGAAVGPAADRSSATTRRLWRVSGQVQGVGYRPFVYGLAQRHGLTGFVRNDLHGLWVEAQGGTEALERFARALETQRPPLARVQSITCQDLPTRRRDAGFRIDGSTGEGGVPGAAVTADAAVCPQCVDELFGSDDRRRGYGLINCTNCGPRYTIVRRVPYDRPNTTMAGFALCDHCRSEYADPTDRRFHAQPIACHRCGPKVELVDMAGRRLDARAEGGPVAATARCLARGQIVAIKGLGGFHLAVRADDGEAVARLRQRKHRDAKPLAVMVPTLEQAQRLVQLSDAAGALWRSPACPIVLARRRARDGVAPGVAPGNHRLGVILPYTPIQHLLFAAAEAPLGPLVMTSANASDEPLVIDNAEARQRLAGLCDAILQHDRPIERCVDDSVVLDPGHGPPLPIRRARGYAPTAVPLPRSGRGGAADRRLGEVPDGLCVGGELKGCVAVVRDGQAILGQHLGDLTHPLAFDYFKKAIRDLCELFGAEPRWIAHDLHPAYLSAQHAAALSRQTGARLLGIQHHHAHAAAVMAEHDCRDPVLALVCDGAGYGTDGTIWGGELFRADLVSCRRLARLRPLRLPGGDAAARDTRRAGLALLHHAFGDDFAQHPFAARLVPDAGEREMLGAMIRRQVQCALNSGAGRLFDGFAALLGLCEHNHYEAQAALALEAAADSWRPSDRGAGFDLRPPTASEGLWEIDPAPLVRATARRREQGAPVEELAADLHAELARAWAAVTIEQSRATGLGTAVLSGGVFCNEILTRRLTELLAAAGLRVLRHRLVPPNDGGLALGQAAVAAAQLAALAPTPTERGGA